MSLGTVDRLSAGGRAHRAVHAFFATMRISAAMPVSDTPFRIIGLGLRVLQFGVLVGIWRSLPADRLAASGLTVSALLTYSALAQAVGPLLNPQTSLTEHIANGSLAVRMLWPMGVVSQFASEMLGAIVPITLVGAAVISGAALLFHVPLTGAGSPSLFVLSLLLAIVVGLAVDFWFALLTVRLGNGIWFVNAIRAACTSVISGALIPLSLMPWHVGRVLQVLPFAAMASGPLRVYTQSSGAATLLASQAAWAIVLWAGVVWWAAKSRDKVVGQGG